MDMFGRYREWLEGEVKSLEDQIRIIEAGTAQYHTMKNGKLIDTTDQLLTQNKDKLRGLQELLAAPKEGFQTHVGEMKPPSMMRWRAFEDQPNGLANTRAM